MYNRLYSRLEIERAMQERLWLTDRKDAVALLLLKRVSQEIKYLEGKLNGQASRKTRVKYRYTYRLIQYVCKAVCRFRDYKNRRDHSISALSEKAILQTQAGAQ